MSFRRSLAGRVRGAIRAQSPNGRLRHGPTTGLRRPTWIANPLPLPPFRQERRFAGGAFGAGAARGEADQRSEPRRAGRRWVARFDAPCRTPQRERSLEASLRSLFNRANGASRPLAQGSPRTRAVPPREFSKRGRPWSGKPRRPLLPRAQQPRSATAQPQLATAPRRSISPRQRANRARSEALPAGVNTRSTGTTCQSSGSPAARNATPRAVASRNA